MPLKIDTNGIPLCEGAPLTLVKSGILIASYQILDIIY